MGQRLVINIKDKNGNTVANSYYHWSAYTSCSLNLTKQIIDTYVSPLENLSENERIIAGINMLATTGASLTPDAIAYLEEHKIPPKSINSDAFNECNRNNGLIGIGEKGINDNLNWAEGIIDFYPDNENFDMGCMLFSDDASEMEDCDKINLISNALDLSEDSIDDDEIDKLLKPSIDKLPLVDFDPCHVAFDDIGRVLKELTNTYQFVIERSECPTIFSTIE